MDMLRLRPSEILYSKRCIESQFSDGTPLTKVFAQLISGRLRVTDLQRIEVDSDDELVWWTINGNRRLFLYKKLESAGVLTTIEVRRVWSPLLSSRMDSTSDWDGKTVFCYSSQGHDLELTLDDIVCDWHKGRNVMEKWDDIDQGSTTKFGHSHKSDKDGKFGKEHHDEDKKWHDGGRRYLGIQHSDYSYGDSQSAAAFECCDEDPQFDYNCVNDRDSFKFQMPHGDSSSGRKVGNSSLRKEPKYKRKNPLYDF